MYTHVVIFSFYGIFFMLSCTPFLNTFNSASMTGTDDSYTITYTSTQVFSSGYFNPRKKSGLPGNKKSKTFLHFQDLKSNKLSPNTRHAWLALDGLGARHRATRASRNVGTK